MSHTVFDSMVALKLPPPLPLDFPIVCSRWLRGPSEFYLVSAGQIVASPEAMAWMRMFLAAAGWPVRDLAASEDAIPGSRGFMRAKAVLARPDLPKASE